IWLTEKTIEEYINNPFINPNYRKGLDDTLDLAIEELSLSGYFESFKEELKRELTLCEYKKLLMDIRSRCKEVEKIEGKTYWVSKLRGNVTTYIKELQIIAPWVDLSGSKDSILSKTLNNILLETSLKNITEELNILLEDNKEELTNNSELRILIKRGIKSLEKLKYDMKDILSKLKSIGDNMDFSMLYNKDRGLFSIGYDVNNKTLNNSYYDLMASEARVASYVAITKGDVPEEHWWNLGRSLTPMGRGVGLLSWSGTMFEYLMPFIILKNYEGSLWNETYKGVVEEQVYYGEIKKIPWGISESGYFHFDNSMIYQYKAFGIPKAGLKRGLEDDTVISPYSTMMALMVDYKKAIRNLKVLERNKVLGLYGFYEALDYTKDRVSKGKEFSIIKSFMIHHEGMALMSIVNVLSNNIFRERFHKKEEVISGELLLQESTYRDITFHKERFKEEKLHNKELPEVIVRNYNTGITEFPESVVLSNGSYHTMINNSGSGFSKVKDMNLYRWSKDYVNDNKGMFIYLRDMSSSEYWSATFQPTKRESDKYHVDFTLHKAEFTNQYRGIESKLSVAVSNEENMEVRALTLENNTEEDKVIEITTYLEVTLSTQEADISHKAFSNLFIRTESFEDNVLLAYRRPRAKGQKKPYIFQKILFQGEKIGAVEYETSRLNFIGRGNDEDNPRVMNREIPLENSEGTVIDPIFSQRIRMKIPKGEKVKAYVVIGSSESKEEAIDICNRYSSIEGCRGIFNGSYNNSLGELSYLGLKYKQASLYQMMASRILYTNKDIRRRETYIKSLNKHQKDLWSFGVSGDLPIVTLNIKDTSHVDIVRQCVQCHEYLNRRGVEFDLLVINEEEFSYDMPLQGSLFTIINKYSSASINNLRGKIFIQSYDNLKDEGISFIKAISTIYIDGKEEDAFFSLLFKGEDNLTYNLRGLPKEVYNNSIIKEEVVEEMPLKWKREKYMAEIGESIWEGNQGKSSGSNEECYDIGRLKFFNGLGGFNEKNHYVIVLKNNNNTPAPWINVISNKKFGFHISESGSSYTWYKNSRENKLTPWNNDFVSDTLGEALFLRDEENGEVFSITPKPLRGKEEYVVEHGFGFSKFSHMSNDIKGEITWFTPLDHSLKIGIVKLKNLQGNKRKISLTYYSNLILGVNEQGVHKTISTYYDEEGNFIYGKNPYSEKFGDTNCYLKIIGGEDISYCGDREDFIGRGRNINSSMAMDIDRLNNKVGGGFDSILSYRTSVYIEGNEEKILTIVMGAEENIENIRNLLGSYSTIDFVSHKLNEVETHWRNLVGTFEVSTPDDSLNILANGWLLYQVISCRYYSRTAFYQSGGAYGYRDQLQDSLSIGLVDSNITRNQIRLNASRQYEEGDVQHWWHPVVDSGIRTRFSDDLLWLPYGVIDYINNTGDYSILEEEEYYLKDEPLAKGEDERYTLTNYSTKKGTIYEHCIKAIDRSLKLGEHGIPLMGCGDWNDGMSTVGNKGTGESVWLGWFLSYILKYFPDICKHMGDVEREEKYLKFREEILNNIEENAWDGAWYRRAYFDDGTPLGSIENEECSIDSLPQSWSIIAEGNNRERQIKAMKSVEDYLVNQLNGMILLLSPPFDSSKLEPGYIKGYVPGVRENGGQYTHAALWVIMAMAEIGNTERALELLNMINPINHTLTFKECEKYKVEPYVITADVYIKEPHGGRGGWSWYTGAASWTYKVILQSILGFQLVKGKGFTVNVNMPSSWNKYSITYRRNEKEIYNITVTRGEEKGLYMNSKKIDEDVILFSEGIHEVSIIV
ncbi:glucoamylase family protein, partial [Clostridium sp.]|uniref:GH36-type glycosyl hydrolase domain-containing protein n=1 Tax=Clostridium sp. TaxID=1506 RepID=UPI003463D8A6